MVSTVNHGGALGASCSLGPSSISTEMTPNLGPSIAELLGMLPMLYDSRYPRHECIFIHPIS